ncbi:MAG: NAD(+)/NADH kinase [Bacteroidota bacterium]
MIYGITGNPLKDGVWDPVATLVQLLEERGASFRLHPALSEGLAQRGLFDAAYCSAHEAGQLAHEADVIICFGGDGTLLRYAQEVGPLQTPLLGVNVGRLGFLADITVAEVSRAVDLLEQRTYRVEDRLVLQVHVLPTSNAEPGDEALQLWALNEVAVHRSGTAGLITVHVQVADTPLNAYWADGLIIATPTGSTAYSLSAGGPILMPETQALVLTPVAPHTLTMRPLVLPDDRILKVHVDAEGQPFVVSIDGMIHHESSGPVHLTVQRAAHSVKLIKFPEQSFFKTLRTKLMWGRRARSPDDDG